MLAHHRVHAVMKNRESVEDYKNIPHLEHSWNFEYNEGIMNNLCNFKFSDFPPDVPPLEASSGQDWY